MPPENNSLQEIDIRTALRQAIDEEMQRDHTVFILGEEVGKYDGAYKITKGLLNKWGATRVLDTPICEAGFTGLAIGAALTGLRPIVEFMSWNFSFVAIDQILSNAAKMYYMTGGKFSVPIVFRGPNGAAAQVSCQHSHSVEALYSNFPGLIILTPSNALDAKGLLKTAIRNNNPVLFLENELGYSLKMNIPKEEFLIPIGKARIVKEGQNLTLISHGHTTNLCKEAIIKVENKRNISIDHIDLRSIKPLDIPTIINSIMKTHRCLIVEEGHRFCGIGAEISAIITEKAFDYLDAPILRVYQKEVPMPYSKNLEQETLPNVNRIIVNIEKILD